MAISISNFSPIPTFLSSHSVSSVFRENEVSSSQTVAPRDESPQRDQSSNAVLNQADRVELSQEARQQAQQIQVSSANPGTPRHTASPFDAE